MSSSSTWADSPRGSFHVEQAYQDRADACPVCGANAHSTAITAKDLTVSQLDFQIERCHACDAHFTTPRPSPENIGEFYRSTKYISHTDQDKSILARVYRAVRKHAISQKLKLIHRTHSTGRLFDLGCGTGAFIKQAAHRGFQVTGVEPSAEARKHAAATTEAQIYAALSDVPKETRFDVVTMWHVLEHMYAPAETLKTLHKHMAENGLLVIAVPNRDSWDASHYGRAWAAWDVPRHLTHFSGQDVLRILERTGFRILGTRPMWFDAPYVAILSERARGRGPVTSVLLGTMTGAISNLIALVTARPTSSTIFLAQKKDRV